VQVMNIATLACGIGVLLGISRQVLDYRRPQHVSALPPRFTLHNHLHILIVAYRRSVLARPLNKGTRGMISQDCIAFKY